MKKKNITEKVLHELPSDLLDGHHIQLVFFGVFFGRKSGTFKDINKSPNTVGKWVEKAPNPHLTPVIYRRLGNFASNACLMTTATSLMFSDPILNCL